MNKKKKTPKTARRRITPVQEEPLTMRYMQLTKTHASRLATVEPKKLIPRTYSPKTTNKAKHQWLNLSHINSELVLGSTLVVG
jgi:hypothetical protein